ncbi:MAG: hypothetical protein ACI8WB_005166 [Phenylobacterium sp.]|jgi:hypothetical protein
MIKRITRFILLGVVLSTASLTSTAATIATTAPAASKQVIKPFIARYKLSRAGKERGTAERELVVFDSLYRLRYKSSIKWLIFSDERSESSEFKIDGQRVRPLSYKMERAGTGPDRTYSVTFDRDGQTITATRNKKTKRKKKSVDQPKWDEDWLDPISYQQQLVLDLQQGKKTFNYHFVNREGLQREYQFKVVGEESLTLPYGTVKAIKVERQYDETSERQTIAWFAPELDYALVRIYKAKGGSEQFDIQLTELVR